MKYFFLTTLSVMLIGISVLHAQELSREFGKISKAEFDLTRYEKDPDAEAVVLFDIGKSSFYDDNTGFNIRFVRKRRIKILKKTGTGYGEVTIPYYVDGYDKTEAVKKIEAYSYNFEDGVLKKTELKAKDIFSEKVAGKWWQKKFAIPQVKEGSIIEFSYVIETPFLFNLRDWDFQDRIPTIYSEYEVRLIPFFAYAFQLQGARGFHKHRSFEPKGMQRQYGGVKYTELVHQFAMKDVAAFKDESFISSINDYKIKLDFQLAKILRLDGVEIEYLTTWEKLNEDLLKDEDFGKYLKSSRGQAKKIFPQIGDLSGKSDLEKVELIADYIKKNYSWNGRKTMYGFNSPKQVVSEKTGSSGEINLLLTTLLSEAGIESHPVILSTRDHGKIKGDYPFLRSFNYVVAMAKVDGTNVLIDGTEPLLAFDKIPTRCINEKGLVVQKGEAKWIGLTNRFSSVTQEQLFIEVKPDEEKAVGKFTKRFTEYDAHYWRHTFGDNAEKIKAAMERSGFEALTNLETSNFDNLRDYYTIKFQAKKPVEAFGDKLLVAPFLELPMSENRLKQPKRVYPVDMVYAVTRQYSSVIKVPEGYEVAELPIGYSVNDNLVKIIYDVKEVKGIVKAEGSFTFKKSLYLPNEYFKLRKHFETIVSKFNESIVLQKTQEESNADSGE
ncbi:MAG: DUF3857 domain-containing protein [Bacteroidota bacterium]